MRKRKVYRGPLSFLLFLEQPQTQMILAPGGLDRAELFKASPARLTLSQRSWEPPPPRLRHRPLPGSFLLPSRWGTDSPSCHVSLMTSTQPGRP